MDIVSRLKAFIDYTAFPVTQFADTATIPRPTLSQILNGRNKKISNEILDKLHKGFPDLNMMWLMFGDGEMTVPGATPTQRQAPPQNASTDSLFKPQATEVEEDSETDEPQAAPTNYEPISKDNPMQTIATQFSLNSDASKKIQNIMVFYSDNSFEIFVPSNR